MTYRTVVQPAQPYSAALLSGAGAGAVAPPPAQGYQQQQPPGYNYGPPLAQPYQPYAQGYGGAGAAPQGTPYYQPL